MTANKAVCGQNDVYVLGSTTVLCTGRMVEEHTQERNNTETMGVK